jgi:hypothetical protein
MGVIRGSGRSKSRIAVLAAAGAVSLTAAAGLAYAIIPDSTNGVITACYPTSGTNAGQIKVIDAQGGATCPAGSTTITWNQRGIRFRSAYNAATPYLVNDVVTKGGTAYVAKLANTGVPVTNTTNWEILAAKGAAGVAGPAGPAGPSGPKGSNTAALFYTLTSSTSQQFALATAPFTAPANATCLVTSSVQLAPLGPLPTGSTSLFVRNAVSRNGVTADDGLYGQYLVSVGVGGQQPSLTRSSVVAVTQGDVVQFGAYLGNASLYVGGSVAVQTSYLCS